MFGLQITNDRAASLRFDKFPDFAHDRLLAALQNIEQRLEAAVIAAEPARSGALKALTGGRVYDHGNRISAVVGVRAQTADEARKAAALEYGSRRTAIEVKMHSAKLAHVYSRAIAEISVSVPTHSRTPNITADRFLRGPLDAIHAEAMAELQAAMQQATEDANKL
nr:hypothetical protein [uncultured Rhodopila sp.]